MLIQRINKRTGEAKETSFIDLLESCYLDNKLIWESAIDSYDINHINVIVFAVSQFMLSYFLNESKINTAQRLCAIANRQLSGAEYYFRITEK